MNSGLRFDKRAIAQRFSRAAAHYDPVAHLQRQMGEWVLETVRRPAATSPVIALDIGCGTGQLTQQLQPLCDRLIGLDLAPGMLQFARQQHGHRIHHFICADADALPFAPATLDLVVSNFALQWSESLPALVQQLFQILRPGGQLVFSIPLTGTLHELEQSWQQADPLRRHVNRFIASPELQGALTGAGFVLEQWQVFTRVMRHASVADLGRELKTLGAHTLVEGHSPHLTGKRTLRTLLAAYEPWRGDDGLLPATWNIACVSARKPAPASRAPNGEASSP